jgi:glycosyltransferase involved in cell wall biosynthesis
MRKSPQIAVNMWSVTTLRGGGMIHYALSLLRELTQLIPNELIVFFSRPGKRLIQNSIDARTVRCIELSYPGEIYDFRHLFDVLFFPGSWSGMNMLDRPLVHVIPDIQHQFYPEYFSPDELAYRNEHYLHSALASTYLITISEFSRRTMIEKFGVPAEKIRVTHLGVHPAFSSPDDRGMRPAHLPENLENYLFYPANSWKHKNHIALLDALAVLRDRNGLEPWVIFTGHLLAGDFNRVDIPAEARRRGLNRVHHLGVVSLAELKYLYLHAAALVHPSLFEGFGIPLLEAMTVGLPILAADRASIPEVAGEAALYFNPDDANDIAKKIAHFFAHPDEAVPRVVFGKDRAKNFSDRRMAGETLKILSEAYEKWTEAPLWSKASRPCFQPGTPVLTIGAIVGRECPREFVSELSALTNEMKDKIQVVAALLPGAAPWLKRRLSSLGTEVFEARTFREALVLIADKASGTYVALSDGEKIPRSSFVDCLTDGLKIGSSDAQLIHGYTYCKYSRKGIVRDAPGAPALGDAEARSYCLDNLSFVVRREAFQDVIWRRPEGFPSMDRFFPDLWERCSRERVYRIINFRLWPLWTMCEADVSFALKKLHNIIPDGALAGRMLRSSLGLWTVRLSLIVYCQLPASFRTIVTRGAFRLLLGKRTNSAQE